MNKFSINWKVKSFIYKFLFFFKAQNFLFFIQKKITKRASIKILEIDNLNMVGIDEDNIEACH